MRVDVARVKEARGSQATYSLTGNLSISLPGPESRLSGPVQVECSVTNTGRSILVQGQVRAHAAVACDRCLGRFGLTLRAPLYQEYVAQGTRVDDETDALYYTGDEIEIDDAVRQALLLEWPSKLVCSDSCQGLCPGCGRNLNVERCGCAVRAPGEGV